MIRLIARQQDATTFVHTQSGHVEVTYRTFDVDAPELEAWLKAIKGTYLDRSVIGAELDVEVTKK